VRSDKRLKFWYNLINKKFFNGELPTKRICVRWINEQEQEQFEDSYFAWTSNKEDFSKEALKEDRNKHDWAIIISRRKNPGRTAVVASLAHEMCHVATKMRDDHGPAFEAKRQMIADRGIFKKGAVLKGLTIF
jgi:hypothetical protein